MEEKLCKAGYQKGEREKIIANLCWAIWSVRNKFKFERSEVDPSIVLNLLKKEAENGNCTSLFSNKNYTDSGDQDKSFAADKMPILDQPGERNLKIFIDAAFDVKRNMVVRYGSVVEAEAFAFSFGCDLVEKRK